MSSLRCSACGLVNFASAEVCKRCATPLTGHAAAGGGTKAPSHTHGAAAASKGGTAPVPVLLQPETINGIGVDIRDHRKLSDETYLVTRCVTFLWVPLIPLSVWVIRPINRELSFLTTSETHNFERLEDRDLDLESVLRLYGLFLLWVALSAGPFLLSLMLMIGDRTPENRPGYFVGVIFLLSIPWSLGFPLWLKRRRDRLYKLVNKSIVARALGAS